MQKMSQHSPLQETVPLLWEMRFGACVSCLGAVTLAVVELDVLLYVRARVSTPRSCPSAINWCLLSPTLLCSLFMAFLAHSFQIYIPQYGVGTASLNVSTATAIILHHFARWAGYAEVRHPPPPPPPPPSPPSASAVPALPTAARLESFLSPLRTHCPVSLSSKPAGVALGTLLCWLQTRIEGQKFVLDDTKRIKHRPGSVSDSAAGAAAEPAAAAAADTDGRAPGADGPPQPHAGPAAE
jgi:hypothetical protein